MWLQKREGCVVKRIFGLSVIIGAMLVSSISAQAADLPQAPPPQAPVAYIPAQIPLYNWSGVYLGINGGWGFGTAKWTVAGFGASSAHDNGGVIGGTLGFNYQINALVIGVEGDADFSGINGNVSGNICSVGGNCQSGNNWLSTLRGRIGFAADRVLFYGTAGGVFGNVQITQSGTTNTHTQAGWTAGLGMEVALAQNWTAKIEYLYANLGTGSVTCTTACAGLGLGAVPVSVGLTDNLIRVGVNYKFNF
jgi:outer membrane immunogenic protein